MNSKKVLDEKNPEVVGGTTGGGVVPGRILGKLTFWPL